MKLSSRQALTPARYYEGTRSANRNAAKGDRGCNNTRLSAPSCEVLVRLLNAK